MPNGWTQATRVDTFQATLTGNFPDCLVNILAIPLSTSAGHKKRFIWFKIASFKEGELIKSALETGVIGYLLKDISANQLARAIRTATSGRATISAEVAQALVETANQSPEPGLDLTDRERGVLVLLIEGLNKAQIEEKLVVAPFAIKSHISNILSKLSVASYAETVTLVLGNFSIPDHLNLIQMSKMDPVQLRAVVIQPAP
jgi:two-component system, NarL family, response regulator LiaR